MLARLNNRLKQLENKIAPKGRHLVFVFDGSGEPGAPSRDEQLAAFKAQHSLAPGDHLHEVTVTSPNPATQPTSERQLQCRTAAP